MALPGSLPVEQLDAQHPEYACHAIAWDDIDLLYRGGHAIKEHAGRFLVKRPKELSEVYSAREQRFAYQNILGTALGWYQSAMFTEDPDVIIQRGEKTLPADEADFYGDFQRDCTRSGCSMWDVAGEILLDLMLYRSAYILKDLPPQEGQAVSRADQKANGALDPYLVIYDPRQVINWECDQYGCLAWVVIATTTEQRTFGAKSEVVDRWYYFDREQYGVYEAKRKDNKKAEVADLVAEGPHAMSDIGEVPVRRVEVKDALWLADRVYTQVLDHLNQDNSYSWALFMANLPVPVIKGEFNGEVKASETAYIHLAENGAFEWAEPSGTSFEHSANRISSLREEIYRQMYLQAQARSNEATPAAQSGISKEQDMAPSKDVLNAFGDVLRRALASILADVAAIRGDTDLTFEVRGFDFSDTDTDQEVKAAESVDTLGIQSDTLRKETHKRVARCLLRDAQPELLKQVEAEIDAAPTQEEQQAADEQKLRERVRAGITGSALAA
jgi:hypothetical protein